jgi:AAA domain
VVVDGPPEPTDSRTNLPAARVVLYGRAAEIERLAGEVLSAPGRLVTITGPGGVGKTSVALAVARHVLPNLHHGVWFVDLSTLTMSRAVLQAVARATGVRESYAATIDEALTAFLRDRELLLVMDNCEHVVDACGTLLDELLDQAPGLRVLATSREPLRIPRRSDARPVATGGADAGATPRSWSPVRDRVGPALPRSSMECGQASS